MFFNICKKIIYENFLEITQRLYIFIIYDI